MSSHNNAVLHALKTFLIRGALFVAPIALVLFLFDFINNTSETWFGSSVSAVVRFLLPYEWRQHYIPDGHIPGLSLLVFLMLLFLIGFLASWKVGREGLRLIDYMFLIIPGVSSVYRPARKMIELIGEPDGKSRFQKVVYLKWTGPMKAIGFVTGELTDVEGAKYYFVVAPHVPNPMSGTPFLIPESETTESGLSIAEGTQMCLSLGLLVPPEYKLPKFK